jgi:hypothetical protein
MEPDNVLLKENQAVVKSAPQKSGWDDWNDVEVDQHEPSEVHSLKSKLIELEEANIDLNARVHVQNEESLSQAKQQSSVVK